MEEDVSELTRILPFLAPLLVLQVVLLVIALVDLIKRERVRGNNKVLWALVIVVVNIIGPVLYLLAGRMEGPNGGDQG